MKSGGLQLRANLALAGHPNQFQSKPVAIKGDWDLLQDMDHRTLLCTTSVSRQRKSRGKGKVCTRTRTHAPLRWQTSVHALCAGTILTGFIPTT